MTTTEVATYANEEGLVIGAADINLQVRLRRKVIPKFEMDVGEAAWRRKQDTLSISANDRDYDLPTDFGKMLTMPLYRDYNEAEFSLDYIGEDTARMARARATTETGSPNGYWIERLTATPKTQRVLYLETIPDAAFTLYFSYLQEIYFEDNTTSVDLDQFIPPKLQWALVEGLKMEIYKNRISVDDPRWSITKAEYDSYVVSAMEYREPGARRAVKRVRTGPI